VTPARDGGGVSKLALRRVSRRFGTVTAVDAFDLTLETGEFVSLLGPSGCGKTTALRMIAGFLEPSDGTIEMDGAVISSPASSLPPEKRKVSDYGVRPTGSGLALRVTARPHEVFEVGEEVWLTLDPGQMSHVV